MEIQAAKFHSTIKTAMGAAIVPGHSVPMAFKDKAIANVLALQHQTMDGQLPMIYQMIQM
jgi:hypothetical protein